MDQRSLHAQIGNCLQTENGVCAFDFPEILGTIAPRGLFINAPMEDSNFEVVGVKECVAAAQGVFRLLNSRTGMQAYYPECKHDFPNEIRRIAYDWLAKDFEN